MASREIQELNELAVAWAAGEVSRDTLLEASCEAMRWAARDEYDDYLADVALRVIQYMDSWDMSRSNWNSWLNMQGHYAKLEARRVGDSVPKSVRILEKQREAGLIDESHPRWWESFPRNTISIDYVGEMSARETEVVDLASSLRGQWAVIVHGYYYEDKTMKVIAEELGISESRLSQIHKEILNFLRDKHEDTILSNQRRAEKTDRAGG